MKVHLKFDAAEFRSAEFQQRIAEFREKIGLVEGKLAPRREATAAIGAEAASREQMQRDQFNIFKEMRDGINALVDKKAVEVAPANLG
jgi:hypothetical protein